MPNDTQPIREFRAGQMDSKLLCLVLLRDGPVQLWCKKKKKKSQRHTVKWLKQISFRTIATGEET